MDYSHCDSLEGDGWVAIDLDATLAFYDGPKGELEIGMPIAPMQTYVRSLIRRDVKVCIFTARMSRGNTFDVKMAIQTWCEIHLGKILPITCIKGMNIKEFFDDRAHHVVPNKGIVRYYVS